MNLDNLKSIEERNNGNDSDNHSPNSAFCDLYVDIVNRFTLRKSESFSIAFSADQISCVSLDLKSTKQDIFPLVIDMFPPVQNYDAESCTSSFLLSSGSIDEDLSYGTEFIPEDMSYLPAIQTVTSKAPIFVWDVTPNDEDTDISSVYIHQYLYLYQHIYLDI